MRYITAVSVVFLVACSGVDRADNDSGVAPDVVATSDAKPTPDADPNCGNSVVDPNEECDGENLGGLSCTDLGLQGGELSCNSNCFVNTSDCWDVQPECGNSIVEAGEDCDNGWQNSDTEPNACRTNCTFSYCGDGVIDAGEACDGTNLFGYTCENQGFVSGSVACDSNCTVSTLHCVEELDYGAQATFRTIAANSTHIYWSAFLGAGNTELKYFDKATYTLTAVPNTLVMSITADDTAVYWIDSDSTNPRAVYKMPATGGTITMLASWQDSPGSITVDDTAVYWLTYSEIMTIGKDGTGLSGVYGAPELQERNDALAVDNNNVYWIYGGDVFMMPKTGGLPVTLVAGFGFVDGIVTDGINVYWRNQNTSEIGAVSVSGGPVTVLASTLQNPVDLVVDTTHVYWVEYGYSGMVSGAVRKVPKAGGAVIDLAGVQDGPYAMAIDDTHVYWVSVGVTPSSPSTVQRVGK